MNEFQHALWPLEWLTDDLKRHSGHVAYRLDPEWRRIALLRIEEVREALATIERCIKEGTDK